MIQKKILIVGGGVSGIALAALLEKRGITPVVIEKDNDWNRSGFGITIMPPGLDVLKRLGLYEKILSLGAISEFVEFRDALGHVTKRANMIGAGITSTTLPREDLLRELRTLLSTTTFRMGVTIESMQENTNGVTVRLSDQFEDTFDLVIGADGINSQVRQFLFPAYQPEYVGAAIWNFFLPKNSSLPDPLVTTIVSNSRHLLSIFPIRDSAAVSFCIPMDQRRNLKEVDVASYAEEIPFMGLDILPLVDSADIFSGHLRQVKLPKWHRGRVVLMGDAAHAMLPTSAMGVSSALMDAEVLADQIAVCEHPNLARAAKAYEGQRIKGATRVQKDSFLLWRIIMDDRLPVRLKDMIIRHLPINLLGKKLLQN
ncbi:hypothetical protein CYG49_01935 [Candidatus Saccharibacteria bacterium]|nr:MAG: hypothetical protein CYG49_01935 [Candidatus Saccharibacteria bacterium]